MVQSVGGLNRTKGLTIPQIRGNNSSCLVTFEPGHGISLPLDWNGRHRLCWGSSWLTPWAVSASMTARANSFQQISPRVTYCSVSLEDPDRDSQVRGAFSLSFLLQLTGAPMALYILKAGTCCFPAMGCVPGPRGARRWLTSVALSTCRGGFIGPLRALF